MDLKKTTTTANSIVVASVICGLYQVAHLVPPPNPIWAANVLTYHPIWIQAAFFILSLILLVPFLRSLGLTYFGKLAKVIDPWGGVSLPLRRLCGLAGRSVRLFYVLGFGGPTAWRRGPVR